MAQTLSVLEKYEQGGIPWMIVDGHFFIGSEKAPKNILFGTRTIGIKDKGLVARLEDEQAASRRHLVQGRVVRKNPRTFEDRIIASYKQQVFHEEESARQELLALIAGGRSRKIRSHLEGILESIRYADAYVGTKGELYALHEQSDGPFRFRNERYATEHLGKAARVCVRHEKKMRNMMLQKKKRISVEGQELSSLQITHSGNSYTASLHFEPFALRTPFGTYAFGACKVRYDFLRKQNGVAIRNEPVVVNKEHYIHPFVFEQSGSNNHQKICFNGSERWEENGILFGQAISLSIAEEKIAFVAAETARMMRSAYTKKTKPAQQLSTMPERKVTTADLITQRLVAYGNK